jgi:hypothetical protein
MNKYYILIPLSIIILSVLIYFITRLKNDFKHVKLGLEKYGELGISNCAIDEDSDCNELLDMNNMDYDFKHVSQKNNLIYSIKLIANFLKYLNSDYTNNKLNINNLFNQKLINSTIDSKPIGISYSNQDKTKAFFIFRGTQTAADLAGDTTYNYYDVPNPDFSDNIKIHKFYNNIYQEIKQLLLDCLYDETTEIHIFGHSMGAAISFIMAQDISKNKKYKVYAIGFAPPRTGNRKFVVSLETNCEKVIAIININDVVPTIPFSYMPNLIYPYKPLQFSSLHNSLIYNGFSVSINANHHPITYYKMIKGDAFLAK